MFQRLFGPALAVLREDQTLILHALWLGARHPRTWAAAKSEIAATTGNR